MELIEKHHLDWEAAGDPVTIVSPRGHGPAAHTKLTLCIE